MLLYFEAEQFLIPDPKNTSVKSRVFQLKLKSNAKQVLALVSSTLKYYKYLKEIVNKSKILKDLKKRPKKLTLNLSILLVHDLLFTKQGRIQSLKHPIKEFILLNKTRLQSEYTKLKLKLKVKNLEDLVDVGGSDDSDENTDCTPIRWIRVNTLKVFHNLDTVIFKDPIFAKLSFTQNMNDVITNDSLIYKDEFIPNLFGISPKVKIAKSELYKKGSIIIQDRSSCFPAVILNPQREEHLVDSCAAPGNKTTHLASFFPKSIVAFERNPNRYQVLKTMTSKAGGSKIITCKNMDFTKANPADFANVDALLVDPSCSGSGIFGREQEDNANNLSMTKERLAKLSSFQFTIMKHALSFPNAKRVTYSTCSIHPEENEQVVIDLLNDSKVKSMNWKLATRDMVIPTWSKRGWKKEFLNARYSDEEAEELAGGCIRSSPKEDGGIGFFVCMLVRD